MNDEKLIPEPRTNVDMTPPSVATQDGPRHPGPFGVVGLLVAIAAAITGILSMPAANMQYLSTGLLFLAASTLMVVWFFTKLSSSRSFSLMVTVMLALGLVGGAIYTAVKPKLLVQALAPRSTNIRALVPALTFDDPSPATKPYCNQFIINSTWSIPSGYEVLVFDAPADPRWNVIGEYNYDGQAMPLVGSPNSMISPPVYLGTMTRPGGLPMAGYKVVVVAELMPRAEAQFVKDWTDSYRNGSNKLLPHSSLAMLKTIRNNSRGCGTKPT
jgi:hypothetical protein